MAENVKVAVRVRPFNQREKDRGAKPIISMDGPQTSIRNPETNKDKTFSFDYSYDSFVARDDPSYASQETVWKDIGVGVLNNAYEGYNCSLFAYGQTGAGKSYSMMGYGEDKGIIPIASQKIFERMADNTDPDLTFRVETSMLEIYMEKVKDLFNPKAGDNLKVRNDPKIGFYVDGMSKMAVDTFEKVERLMETGSKARTVASTNMNATSSRAHTIFQIILTQTKVDREAGKATDKTALINLIDLAGSERAGSTGAQGDRLKEGAAINLSLSSLGNCISALAHNSGSKKKKRVPYRDSVLTMLLQNSLGGNAKTIMIAAVSPADINYDETLGTLRYADRAKQIKNAAVVNEDPNEKLIRGLRDEVEELKKKLAMVGGGGGGGGGGGAGADVSGMLEEERAKMEAEKQAEIERIRAELESKMRAEANESKSWEERLKETEAAAEENDAALAQMGVMSAKQKEAAMARAKEEPHIANLNEDPQMNGQIIYFFDDGKETRFGRKDAGTAPDVILGGLSIQREHCVVKNEGGTLTLVPAAGAKTHHNGMLASEPKQLQHLDRLIFGNNHVFVVNIPAQAAAGATMRLADDAPEGEELPETLNFEYAVMEVNRAQVAAMVEEEARRAKEAEEEARKAAERVAEIEAKMRAEMEEKAQETAKMRAELEVQQARMQAEQEEMAKKLKESGADGEEMAKRLKEQEDRLRTQQEEAAKAWEAQQARMREEQQALEAKLQEQIKETERASRRKQREIRERSLLDEKLLKTIPLVNEANAISDELGKKMNFSVKLMANQSKARMEVKKIDEDDEDKDEDKDEEKEEDMASLDTEVFVRIEFSEGNLPVTMWHYDKFMNRLYMMREMYTAWVEVGRDMDQLAYTDDDDPFFDPVEAQLIGRSTIYLDSLVYCLSIKEATPIIDYKGKEEGELLVRIVPHLSEKPPATEEEEDEQEIADKMEMLIGTKLGITVFIDGARGLPPTRNAGVYVQYRFFLDDEAQKTPPCEFRTINPMFEYSHTMWPVVTEELVRYVSADAIEFEVYGNMDTEGKAVARPVTAAVKTREELDDMRKQLATAQVERTEVQEAQDRLARDLEAKRREVDDLKRALEASQAEAAKASAGAGGETPDPKRLAALERENKAKVDEIERLKQELAEAKAQAAKSSACTIL